MNLDTFYLIQALELAKLRRGFCAPNPAVGAIIILDNQILATGYHFAAGSPHAELDALQKLNQKALGATIYSTLEPCCHWGRTPPCTEALIQAGIKRVVYAYRDPNPIVNGKSTALLHEKGILCQYITVPEIDEFYESYSYWHRYKKPFVTAKIALSLDGKIAGPSGEPIAITGHELQRLTHSFRKKADAILTTVKTIHCDNPQLNIREANQPVIAKPIYILDSQLQLSPTMNIFKTAKSLTVFYEEDSQKQLQKLIDLNVRCIKIKTGRNLKEVIELIGQDGIHDLWVEAGGKCFSALITQKLIQRALIYMAPCWIGDGQSAFDSTFSFDLADCKIHWQPVGKDALCDIRW